MMEAYRIPLVARPRGERLERRPARGWAGGQQHGVGILLLHRPELRRDEQLQVREIWALIAAAADS